MKLDFTPLEETDSLDDYEWMEANEPRRLKAIEKMAAQGAQLEDILSWYRREWGPERFLGLKRIKGAVRYVTARR